MLRMFRPASSRAGIGCPDLWKGNHSNVLETSSLDELCIGLMTVLDRDKIPASVTAAELQTIILPQPKAPRADDRTKPLGVPFASETLVRADAIRMRRELNSFGAVSGSEAKDSEDKGK